MPTENAFDFAVMPTTTKIGYHMEMYISGRGRGERASSTAQRAYTFIQFIHARTHLPQMYTHIYLSQFGTRPQNTASARTSLLLIRTTTHYGYRHR